MVFTGVDKDGQHNTTVIRKGLTSQQLVDFCDRARREFYLRPKYVWKQAVMALTNRRERYRVFRGAGTLFKHLFRKHGAPQESSGYSAPKEPSVSELNGRVARAEEKRETVMTDA